MIFPIQTSEFIKSLNFGSNLKKKLQKNNLQFLFFIQKLIFVDKKTFLNLKYGIF